MEITYKNNTLQLPDFMIVGAAKSGTTSVYNYLKANKKVYLPELKEPHFFSLGNRKSNIKGPDNLPEAISTVEQYAALFRKAAPGQLIGEASQSYLYNFEQTLASMREVYGDRYREVKIIILLRNPVDRAWSQYWHFRKNMNEPLPFSEAIDKETIAERMRDNWNVFYDYIGFGNYCEQVSAYEAAFDNVTVFFYEEVKNDSEKVVRKICDRLGVDMGGPLSTDRKFNPSGEPKKNLYGALWRLNVNKNKGLKSIKKIIPYKLRKQISSRMLEKALERQPLSEKEREQLYTCYEGEIEKLKRKFGETLPKSWIR